MRKPAETQLCSLKTEKSAAAESVGKTDKNQRFLQRETERSGGFLIWSAAGGRVSRSPPDRFPS